MQKWQFLVLILVQKTNTFLYGNKFNSHKLPLWVSVDLGLLAMKGIFIIQISRTVHTHEQQYMPYERGMSVIIK